jgi:hypothetical protein
MDVTKILLVVGIKASFLALDETKYNNPPLNGAGYYCKADWATQFYSE